MTSVVATGTPEVTDSYSYDQNGNMTCRSEQGELYNQIYNAENRLWKVQKLSQAPCPEPNTEATQYVTAWWVFTYDGDGNRVSQVYNSGSTTETTAYFMSGLYEEIVGTSSVRKYYAISGMTVAMSDADVMKYLLTDHLGSVAAITDDQGTLLDQQRYLPFGAERPNVGSITQTDFGYTGQRDLPGMGLMDYKARFYDSYLNRFIQPDTIIPNPADPQSWNRYSYVLGNP